MRLSIPDRRTTLIAAKGLVGFAFSGGKQVRLHPRFRHSIDPESLANCSAQPPRLHLFCTHDGVWAENTLHEPCTY